MGVRSRLGKGKFGGREKEGSKVKEDETEERVKRRKTKGVVEKYPSSATNL